MAAPVTHARLRRAPSLWLQAGTQRSSTVVALQSGPLMHIMRLPGPVFSTVFFFWYSQYAYFGFSVPPIASSGYKLTIVFKPMLIYTHFKSYGMNLPEHSTRISAHSSQHAQRGNFVRNSKRSTVYQRFRKNPFSR